jgi:hypothetical protein
MPQSNEQVLCQLDEVARLFIEDGPYSTEGLASGCTPPFGIAIAYE